MIRRAYAAAVEQLRSDPHYPILVPTLLEVAAQYRRLVPGALLDTVRAEIRTEDLRIADWTAVAECTARPRAA